jgi:hypothetical protein
MNILQENIFEIGIDGTRRKFGDLMLMSLESDTNDCAECMCCCTYWLTACSDEPCVGGGCSLCGVICLLQCFGDLFCPHGCNIMAQSADCTCNCCTKCCCS